MRDAIRHTSRPMLRRSQPWLGTRVEISARHDDDGIANRAIDAGFAAIAHVHRAMSPQLVGSDADRINRAAVNESVRVSASTWQVLHIADDLHRRSDGLFDCAIAAGHVKASQRDLDLTRRHEVVKRRPFGIDLGGIAKGFAVDAALDVLRDAGVASGCVNAGGDIAAFGDEPFHVDVRDPLDPDIRHRLVDLRDFAVATSSIEESNALFAGPHAHEVDREAFDRGASICVLAPRCVFADALTKVVALSGTATHPLLASCGASAIVLYTRRA